MRTGVVAHSMLRVGCAFLAVALVAGGSARANPLQRKKLYDLPYPMPEAFRGIRGQDAAIRELLIFGGTVVRPETLTATRPGRRGKVRTQADTKSDNTCVHKKTACADEPAFMGGKRCFLL